MQKADSTLRSSQAVPHPSTNRALCCLTSEVERDPVHSTRYGRRRPEPDPKYIAQLQGSLPCFEAVAPLQRVPGGPPVTLGFEVLWTVLSLATA